MHKNRRAVLYKTNKRRQSEKNSKKVLTNGAESGIISKPRGARDEVPSDLEADEKVF